MDGETGSLKTFLIADVRGYTRFTRERGDEAAAALTVRFSDLVRSAVEPLEGELVEFRGDEVLVAFDSPRRAIQASMRMQALFAEETFSNPDGVALPVGIGLDVGEAAPVGEGYRGNALNIASRLCGLAGAGEVLASREVAHVAGSVEGAVYHDRGSMRLRQLDEPVGVVRVAPTEADPAERFATLGQPREESGSREPMRVVVADDSALFREGVARLLADWGFEVVGQAADADQLLAAVMELRPDVVVTDIRMPPTHTTEGLEAARRIHDELPGVGVMLVSQYVETRHAVALLERAPAGVGYLLKDRVSDVSEFADAVRRVARGGSAVDPDVVARLLHRTRERSVLEELTDREREILSLMAEGRSNRAIGERLFLSPKTVEAHVAHIFSKLGLEPAADDHRRVLAVVMHLREH
jgi:DNA-binding NarL/FixJ family response regulator/class 3 adenylate cyclase